MRLADNELASGERLVEAIQDDEEEKVFLTSDADGRLFLVWDEPANETVADTARSIGLRRELVERIETRCR